MVTFIARIAPDDWVMVAVRDEASRRMSKEAYEALQTLGGSGQRLGFRDSYALIGRKGAASGAAAEQHQARRSGQAAVGLDARQHPAQAFLAITEDCVASPANSWDFACLDAQGELPEVETVPTTPAPASSCFHVDMTYGSKSAGACNWAPHVGLFSPPRHRNSVTSKKWWPKDAVLGAMPASAEECQKICLRVKGCGIFRYYPGNAREDRPGYCWLHKKLTCGKVYTPAQDVISGPREC